MSVCKRCLSALDKAQRRHQSMHGKGIWSYTYIAMFEPVSYLACVCQTSKRIEQCPAHQDAIKRNIPATWVTTPSHLQKGRRKRKSAITFIQIITGYQNQYRAPTPPPPRDHPNRIPNLHTTIQYRPKHTQDTHPKHTPFTPPGLPPSVPSPTTSHATPPSPHSKPSPSHPPQPSPQPSPPRNPPFYSH